MPTVTLKLTDTEEKLDQVYHFLEENQVPFQKAERSEDGDLPQPSQVERLLKRYRESPRLTGFGKEIAKLRKEFREDSIL